VFPDDEWNARNRHLGERRQEVDARERLLDAREQRLTGLEAALDERRAALDAREKQIAERDVTVARREQVADERDAVADRRELIASARERLLDERSAAELTDWRDPGEQIEEAFAREVARLDRSDAFLKRSREAVKRAQTRLDALREAHQRRDAKGGD
jgi:hypothetical protein